MKVLSRSVRDGSVTSCIHKDLNAAHIRIVMLEIMLQGETLSLISGGIVSKEWDKEPTRGW